MALKSFDIIGIGTVTVYKRRGVRNIRLSVAADGKVRVTIPAWLSYGAGQQFAAARREWIEQHARPEALQLADGQQIGKAHRLQFAAAAVDRPACRIVGSEIRVSHPFGMDSRHPDVQRAAQRAGLRALRSQAQTLLPIRLRELAAKYGFTYDSVQIKQLKGRWGSCDADCRIVLNLFLMQLPWQLIDYVLVHELVHTVVLHHGPEFWQEFLRHEPRARGYKKAMKAYQPILRAGGLDSAVA